MLDEGEQMPEPNAQLYTSHLIGIYAFTTKGGKKCYSRSVLAYKHGFLAFAKLAYQ